MDSGPWLDELEFSWQLDELVKNYRFYEVNMKCNHKHYSSFNLGGGNIYQCDDCGKVISEPWRKIKIFINIVIGLVLVATLELIIHLFGR